MAGIIISQPQTASTQEEKCDQELPPWTNLLTAPDDLKQITVRIETQDKDESCPRVGSGVIIASQGNIYTVLTADHVFLRHVNDVGDVYIFDEDYQKNEPRVSIITSDGETHLVEPNNVIRLREDTMTGLDLALVTFESQRNYPFAKLATSAESLDPMNVYGWPNDHARTSEGAKDRYVQGTIYNLDKPDYLGRLNQGYVMPYDADTERGMSGGPVVAVIERNGMSEVSVIGIHGYTSRVRIPTITGVLSLSETLRERKAGIPINTFLDQLSGGSLAQRNWFFNQVDRRDLTLRNRLNIVDYRSDLTTANQAFVKYSNGLRLLNKGSYQDAATELEEAIKQDENYIDAYIVLGDAYHRLGKSDEALARYKIALEKAREKDLEERYAVDIYLRSSAIYYLKGEYDKARQELDEFLKRYPSISTEHPGIYLNRALVYKALGDPEKEEKDRQKALQMARGNDKNPPNALDLVSAGMANYNAGNKEEAFKIWNEAVEIDSDNLNVYLEIGKFLHRTDNPQPALDFWNQLVENNSKSHQVRRQLSYVYDYFNYNDKAIESINKAVELAPTIPEIYRERSEIRLKNQDTQGAIDDLKQAYEIYSNRTPSDTANARQVARRLCNINPTDCPQTTAVNPPNNNPSSGQNPEGTNPTDPKLPEQGGNAPIAAGSRETFYCDPTSGRVTVDRTQNGDRPLITWVSNRFTPWGYDPRLRCQQVSARLQEYRASGNLDVNRITYGRMNDRTVLCVARPERILESSATRCRGGLLILTLEPRQNPEQVVREFKQVLTGTYPNPPLRKELSNPASKE